MLGNDKARKGGNSWKNNSQESSLEGRKERERKRRKERLKGLRPVFPPSLFLTGTERRRMYVWEKFRFLSFFFYFRSRACKRRVEGKAFLCLCLPLDVPKQLFVSLLPLFQFFMVHVVTTDGRIGQSNETKEGEGEGAHTRETTLFFPGRGRGEGERGGKIEGDILLSLPCGGRRLSSVLASLSSLGIVAMLQNFGSGSERGKSRGGRRERREQQQTNTRRRKKGSCVVEL